MRNNQHIYHDLKEGKKKGQKKLAVLIDPDKVNERVIQQAIELGITAKVDYFFIGGSLLLKDEMNKWIQQIKQQSAIPVVIFPGSVYQINESADAILFLSLISGRNPDLLIGQHVVAAPMLYHMDIEVISTGYMLIDGGVPTTVSYLSNSTPIPADKSPIAISTALAGEMLGLKMLYLEAGSGARNSVPLDMIKAVSKYISIPLIIGGGIRSPQMAVEICKAGADVIVVGNAFEKKPNLIKAITQAIHSLNE